MVGPDHLPVSWLFRSNFAWFAVMFGAHEPLLVMANVIKRHKDQIPSWSPKMQTELLHRLYDYPHLLGSVPTCRLLQIPHTFPGNIGGYSLMWQHEYTKSKSDETKGVLILDCHHYLVIFVHGCLSKQVLGLDLSEEEKTETWLVFESIKYNVQRRFMY